MAAARDPRTLIRDRAIALGFDAIGFCRAELGVEARQHLIDFLAAGQHGEMDWLADRNEQRADPQSLWPEARSVIAVGLSYAPEDDPLASLARRDRGTISVYARNRDYHSILKGKLKTLAQFIVARCGPPTNAPPAKLPLLRVATLAEERPPAVKVPAVKVPAVKVPAVKVFVDTAPVMEKPLAAQAGLGWQGKHTNLVSRNHGSWLFLGEIYTTLQLIADAPHRDHCGTCSRCLDVCPTNAFPAPYRLDATRCISYLTIEHAGPIPLALRPLMGNRIYGCDDCLAVCPWNRFAHATTQPGLRPRTELTAPYLASLAALDDAAFRTMFSASPIKRIGRERFVRNVLIAIGNSGDRALLPAAIARLDDKDPVVADAASWAVQRLRGGDE